MCSEFNKAVMAVKGEDFVTIPSIDSYSLSQGVTKAAAKKAVGTLDKKADIRETANLSHSLCFPVGSRVMNCFNNANRNGVANGERGTITSFNYAKQRPKMLDATFTNDRWDFI